MYLSNNPSLIHASLKMTDKVLLLSFYLYFSSKRTRDFFYSNDCPKALEINNLLATFKAFGYSSKNVNGV